MTEREEMIEEMAKVANEKHDKEYRILCTAGGCTKCIAEALYEAGYRKVPEGAVVLTREEAESKFFLEKDNFRKVLDSEREQARKETAREILDLIKRLPTVVMGNDRARTIDICIGYETYYGLKDMLEREYGVEVE